MNPVPVWSLRNGNNYGNGCPRRGFINEPVVGVKKIQKTVYSRVPLKRGGVTVK